MTKKIKKIKCFWGFIKKQQKNRSYERFCNGTCVYLDCRAVSSQIFSAFMVLTAVFGMGTGVTP